MKISGIQNAHVSISDSPPPLREHPRAFCFPFPSQPFSRSLWTAPIGYKDLPGSALSILEQLTILAYVVQGLLQLYPFLPISYVYLYVSRIYV